MSRCRTWSARFNGLQGERQYLLNLERWAETLHSLAKAYSTDPWTIVTTWTLGQLDFNQAVLVKAAQEEKHRLEEAERKRGR